jgi:hypothetical protein
MNRAVPLACVLLVLSSGCSAPAPTRAVFVGRVQSETLKLAQPGEICRELETRSSPTPPGQMHVCVSNACGWSDASLRVVEPIAGSVPAGTVRLRSMLGEWCRPLFVGRTSGPVLVASAGVDPQTGVTRFETYRVIEVAPGQQAFVPQQPSLSLAPWSLDLRPLLKPIRSISFESVDKLSAQERTALLLLPYVCQEGTELVYCKAVYLSDLKAALGSPAAIPASLGR